LLINCSAEQAQAVRERAALQRRTVSGYVLHIVLRSVQFEESLAAQQPARVSFSAISAVALRPAGERTTMLIRCSVDEARRIRAAAKRRDTTISGFMLFCLKRSWEVAERLVTVPQVDAAKPATE